MPKPRSKGREYRSIKGEFRPHVERTLVGAKGKSTSRLADKVERSWLSSRFLQVQNIAATIPKYRLAQRRAAVLFAIFGRHDEASLILKKQVAVQLNDVEPYLMLGAISIKKARLDATSTFFEKALAHSRNIDERKPAWVSATCICGKSNMRWQTRIFADAAKENPMHEAGNETDQPFSIVAGFCEKFSAQCGSDRDLPSVPSAELVRRVCKSKSHYGTGFSPQSTRRLNQGKLRQPESSVIRLHCPLEPADRKCLADRQAAK
jgi:hypothetical protein